MVFRIENRLIFGSEKPGPVGVGNHLFSVIVLIYQQNFLVRIGRPVG